MPSYGTFLIRVFWLGCQLVALMAGDHPKSPYRFYPYYLGASAMLSAMYWPEIPGWSDIFWPWITAVLALRTAAAIEALHVQGHDVPLWGRRMGGAFLWSTFNIAMVWSVSSGPARDLTIQLRRYLQIWTALVMLVTLLTLYLSGWWRARRIDWHVWLIGGVLISHAAISLMYLSGKHSEAFWGRINQGATIWDGVIYLAWGVVLGGDVLPRHEKRFRQAAGSAHGSR